MEHSLDFIGIHLQEAQELLNATHDYVKWQAPLDVQRMDSEQTFKVSSEAMRVTVRLTQIIAWLLLQKAVLTGEMTREALLGEDYRVLRGRQCLEKGAEGDQELPTRLRDLLKESRELYIRVLRLDEVSKSRILAFSRPYKKGVRPIRRRNK